MAFRLLAAAGILALSALGAKADTSLIFPPGEGDFNWQSLAPFQAMDLSGETITVFGPWLGPDQVAAERVLAYFAAATGAQVRYSGSDSFEQQILIDIQAGSPPSIAAFPQPGLARDLAARGLIAPLGADSTEWMRTQYAAGRSWVDLATFDGPDGTPGLYGLFYKIDLKSLVWYVPETFEDFGHEVPTTMEALKALTARMAAEGQTPWCIGLGSGGATGWPGTDWIEDMLLRTQDAAIYDQWVTNKIPFSDARIVGAFDEFGYFARQDAHVAGGAQSVGTTDFRDSPKGLFASPPLCLMHRQASFIPAFFPEGVEIGQDVDFFYFPAYAGKDLGRPVLGAGSLWSITDDSPGARALIEFLKTPIAHELWMAQQGFLTPLKSANPDLYATDALRKMGAILLQADTFRFDGSDLMPGGIGAGSFWTGMIDYAHGKPAPQVTAEIQAAWEALE